MSNWLTFDSGGKTLAPLSAPHIAAIGAVIAVCAVFAILCKSFASEKSKKTFRYTFAAFIAFQQLSLYIWYTVAGQWSLQITLPLQLCDLSIFLSIAVLLSKNRIAAELVYFWGIGGATQAILTPDIGDFTWPHFVFYQFFISHTLIILTCIYMIAAEKFKPSAMSVFRTFIITNLYGLLMIYVNRLTGGNYLFLSQKPSGVSLLDFLGPWPWYLISLDAVVLGILILLYLPFVFRKERSRTTGAGKHGTGMPA